MKVLLINPPRLNEIIGNNPSIIEEERGFNPPLGLLYIAGYLEKFGSFDLNVIDAQVESLDYRLLKRRISEFNPEVVGLTVMTMTLLDVIKTVAIVKELNSSTKVVLGGPHVNLFPEETIALPGVDFLVLGEGEKIFLELLENLYDVSKLKLISGLVFKNGDEVVNTGIPLQLGELDAIPFPARHLVPYKKYNSLLSAGQIVTTIFTSRGCPFQCAFCDRPHLGKKFRARSATNVVNELEACVRMGISDFLFYDDTFTVDRERVIEICEEILRRKLNIGWDIRARVDTIDEEMLVWLKKAGCRGIHYGVEAGTEKILKRLNKGISLDQVSRTFDLTKKHKIPILAYFMIGCPDEELNDILTSFKVMKLLAPDYVHITIFTPFPGTKLYFDGMKNGVIKKDYWKEFSSSPSPKFIPPHWGENFTREELQALLSKGYRMFYMRPFYLLKRLFKIRSANELFNKVKAGAKVLKMSLS